MTLVLGLAPFLVAWLLIRKFDNLRDPTLKARIDTLYATTNYYQRPALMFTPLFLLKRFLFAVTLTYLLRTNLFI
jgi:hypothetical protein